MIRIQAAIRVAVRGAGQTSTRSTTTPQEEATRALGRQTDGGTDADTGTDAGPARLLTRPGPDAIMRSAIMRGAATPGTEGIAQSAVADADADLAASGPN